MTEDRQTPPASCAVGHTPGALPEPEPRPGSSAISRLRLLCPVFRVLLDIVVGLGILLAVAAAVVYYICAYEPRLITEKVEDYLTELTEMPVKINGAVRPVFSPYPGLCVADVRILAATVSQGEHVSLDKPLVEVRELSLFLDPAAMESWELRVHRIEMDTPIINLAYDEQQRPLWLPPEVREQVRLQENAPVDMAALQGGGETQDAGTDASPPDSGADATPPDTGAGTSPVHDPLKEAADTVCLLPKSIGLPVSIKNGSLMSWSADGSLLLSFSGFDGDFSPTALEENLHLNSSFDVPGADLSVAFSIAATVGYEGIPARGRITGRLTMTPPGSRPLHADFDSPFTWAGDGRHVAFPLFLFKSEGDALTADLVADLAEPKCTGKVTLDKLSLTRWFGFGRSLPPGLREALHELVGEFDLVLDANRAEAKNLRGRAGNIAVRGYVGTPDFSKPVVVVDIAVDKANVDLLFPFLAAIGKTVPDPKPPVFNHPPLAPYPVDPKAPKAPPSSSGGVSYDVTIKVNRPTVHDVTGGPLKVTVLPTKVGGVSKTRVGIAASSILKGALSGYIDIDDDTMSMHYEPKGLELALLPENAQNSVKIGGRVTGECDIIIPFKKNGDLADDWPIRVDASISGCEITGTYAKKKWKLHFGTAKAKGKGSIHAVQPDGVRIEGGWDIAGSNIHTSWYPKGKDAISGKFNGGLYWLPIYGKKGEKRGVNRIAGELTANGALVVPIGAMRPPVKGKLSTSLEWMLYGEKLDLRKTVFEGFKSVARGDLEINYGGKDVLVTGQPHFTVSPRDFLRGWDLLYSDSATLPTVATGRATLKATGSTLRFDKIKADVDGSTYTGDIYWTESKRKGDPGLWTFRLATGFLDMDKFIAPSQNLPKGKRPPPPSKTPWRLKTLADLAIDAQLTAQRGKREKFRFSKVKFTAALQRDRFTVMGEVGNFYAGKATVIFQGSLAPERSIVALRKGLAEIHNVDLARLFKDMSNDTAYGGKADLIVDLSGNLTSDADVPAKLSGAWKLSIKDGLYPSFLGSEKSKVRNTFSNASASGDIDKGILRSRNFTLKGPMVDMSGEGWFNLASKDYDMEVSATFAKVPTVPVRLHGSVYEPKMQVRGANMVVETVQNAGSTMFGLVKGILELPAHAVRGIGSLVGGKDDAKATPKTPKMAPHKNQTGHPGQ